MASSPPTRTFLYFPIYICFILFYFKYIFIFCSLPGTVYECKFGSVYPSSSYTFHNTTSDVQSVNFTHARGFVLMGTTDGIVHVLNGVDSFYHLRVFEMSTYVLSHRALYYSKLSTSNSPLPFRALYL